MTPENNSLTNEPKIQPMPEAAPPAARPVLDAPAPISDTAGSPAACQQLVHVQTDDPLPVTIDATPTMALACTHKARRKGRVANLPKHARDLVNRMLDNGIPYKNIVLALSELGLAVTERNISTWSRTGYTEWRFEQDLATQNRLEQDNLVDKLRRDDAAELPEVGLQAAATRLSRILFLKTARADDVEANLGNVSQMVEVLCRINRELLAVQKQRDASRRTLGRAHDPVRIRDYDEDAALQMERYYSNPPTGSDLPKPTKSPILPPEPTAELLRREDLEDQIRARRENELRLQQLMLQFSGKKNPPALPSATQAPPSPK